MVSFSTRPLRDDERDWARERLRDAWGADTVVGRGRVWEPATLLGVVAQADGERVGLATYSVEGKHCEIVTMNSFSRGAGSVLLAAIAEAAREAGCVRVQVMTTNDNTRALRFYQRNGYRLKELRPGAIADARRLKPEIPQTGEDGIPIRDEIDLDLLLAPPGAR